MIQSDKRAYFLKFVGTKTPNYIHCFVAGSFPVHVFFFSRLVVYQQNLAPMCDALRDIGVPCTLESLEFSWASVLMQQKGRDHEDNYPLEGN